MHARVKSNKGIVHESVPPLIIKGSLPVTPFFYDNPRIQSSVL